MDNQNNQTLQPRIDSNNQLSEPVVTQPTSSNMPQPTKNRLVKVLIPLLILLVIVVVGLGVYIWQHNKVNDLAEQLNSSKTLGSTSEATSSILNYNPQQFTSFIYSKLQSAVPSGYTITSSSSAPTQADIIDATVSNELSESDGFNVGPGIASSGYNFIVQPQGFTVSVLCAAASRDSNPSCPSSVKTAVEDLVSKELSGFKYVKGGGTLGGSDGPNTTVNVYENNVADCYVDYDGFGDGIFLACSDKSDYPTTYQEVKSLVNATSTPGSGSAQPSAGAQTQVFIAPIIGSSQTSGYKYAYMTYNSAWGYFYEKGSTWYYLGAGQDGLSCTDFSSDATTNAQAMIAFQGQPCMDSSGNSSTVQ